MPLEALATLKHLVLSMELPLGGVGCSPQGCNKNEMPRKLIRSALENVVRQRA